MTHNTLHTITAVFSVGGYGLRQFGNLIHILTDVTADIPREIVGKTMTVSYSQLPTVVLYLTGIDPLARTFSHSSDTFHEEQDVFGFLVEPVETTIDLILQDCEVNTDIVLCGGLPLDIIVTALVANIAVLQIVATVLTADVV